MVKPSQSSKSLQSPSRDSTTSAFGNEDAAGWSKHRIALAEWVFARLVNRTDAWGAYWSDGEETHTYTAKEAKHGRPLDLGHVARHFSAADETDVLGLHAIGLDGTCQSTSVDIDFHKQDAESENPAALADRNYRYAQVLLGKLQFLGLRGLLWASNEKGGFHLDVHFETPVPSEVAYRFGLWLVADWKLFGFAGEVETFPKAARRHSEYAGNWLRFVGRHPKRDYWAQVYNQESGAWLRGEDAALHVLSFTGNDPAKIPAEALVETPKEVTERATTVASAERQQRYIENAARHGTPILGGLKVAEWLRDNGRSFVEKRSGVFELDVCPFNPEHVGGSAVVLQQASGALGFKCHHNSCAGHHWQDAKRAIGLPLTSHWSWSAGGAEEEPEWDSIPVETIEPVQRPILPMDEIQDEMRAKRLQSIGVPGVNLCRSGTGTRKTTLAVEAAAVAAAGGERVLFILPTHQNCREVLEMFAQHEANAGVYPQRLGVDAAERKDMQANCWNPEADLAQSLGLSVASAVCPGCLFKDRCQASGYLHQLNVASELPVAIATHARGALTSLSSMASGRSFVVIDEDPVDVLRPTSKATVVYLPGAVELLLQLLDDPRELNLLGDAIGGDDQYSYLCHLLQVAEYIQTAVAAASGTSEISLPMGGWVSGEGNGGTPPGVQGRLLRNARERKLFAPIWRILFAAANGSLRRLYVVLDSKPVGRGEGGLPIKETTVSLQAVWSNAPPVNCTTWLQDGTADVEIVRTCLPPGRVLVDQTPEAVPPSLHPVVQIPRDITRKTSDKVWASELRAVLANHPEAKSVGVIHHSSHKTAAAVFKAADGRIGRTSHFGSGLDAASNCWTNEGHDLLIVMGTPRTGPDAVRGLLLQMGDIDSACVLEPAWEKYRWTGYTSAGEPVAIEGRRYADPRWQRAWRGICRAKLLQAVGRGRTTCENGLRVVVLTSEDAGLPISDSACVPMNATEARVLKAVVLLTSINELCSQNDTLSLYKTGTPLIGKGCHSVPVKTGAIVADVGLARQNVLGYLKSLESRGLVIHLGKRGWLPVRNQEPEPPEEVENEPEPMVATKPDSQERSSSVPSGVDDGLVIPESVQNPDMTIERVPFHRSPPISLPTPSVT